MTLTQQILLPLISGLLTVLIGILVLRLHALLALLLAAAVTGMLTFPAARNEYQIQQSGQPIGKIALASEPAQPIARENLEELRTWYVFRDGKQVGILYSHQNAAGDTLYFPAAPDEASEYRPTDMAVERHDYERIQKLNRVSVPTQIANAFGEMAGKIGMMIAFATIIGKCLMDSGGADRIVRSALRRVGERGAPLAFAGSGFVLAIPVFFDTVFLLMIPLGKSLRLRTGRNYLLYVLTIFCGATMAHSLIPPTPGPLLVAESLNVDLGLMILCGGIVGLLASICGLGAAILLNRWIDIPLRESADMPLAELQMLAERTDAELPSLWLSLLPILLPIFLIGSDATVSYLLDTSPAWLDSGGSAFLKWIQRPAEVLGDKHTALALGVVAALWLLASQIGWNRNSMRTAVGEAIAGGGTIILITAAGGAFGKMIEETGVSMLIRDLPQTGATAMLIMAFCITTAIRTAQGSATVAMITAVGLFAGLSPPFHPVWLALAIGCGSKPFSWMTDSGFWVISKMSGMTETETLKTLTPLSGVMGLSGLLFVLIGAAIAPMN